ncbi:hypothetical protein BDY17DRAFT_299194 [Neohortaea acidophila]|uniref:Zn(2)-C6 fungal-type domain-containing protein n=1 Tax=Neohortaea acidophila TaxID=245834 RepID=A0A6A6PTL4_9PEZI|nr:uncharacterized protein BDY17DRAFT_299194 [Neohortaea acidophila]KAF2482803.1 hypothetical protein BDY17DRAFT_299194 [Neohortaea acidophila]
MERLAASACQTCRSQKLKCSRSLGKCHRCVRLGRDCVYLLPPDRKEIGLRRAIKSRAQKRALASVTSVDDTLPPQSGAERTASSDNDVSYEINERDVAVSIPDLSTQQALIDIYFSRTFNASVTFHQPTVLRQWRASQLPQIHLLSMCAMAASLLAPGCVIQGREQLLGRLEDAQKHARQWALWVGNQVLQLVQQPNLVVVQACIVVATYWISQGDANRHSLFSAIATRTTRNMLLAMVRGDMRSNTSATYAETMRRCFWAAWTMNCVVADHYIVGTAIDPVALSTPLPISEGSFRSETPQNQGTLASPHRVNSHDSAPLSIAAETIKLVAIWSRVQDFVQTKGASPAQKIVSDLLSLDQELNAWTSSLPSAFDYNKRNLFEYLVVKGQFGYVSAHALLHQCHLVLHASIVPRFGGRIPRDAFSIDVVRSSARSVFESAKQLSIIANDLAALEWEPASLSPFFGWAMYASAAIHLLTPAQPDALSAATSSLRVLKGMKPYWQHLNVLWDRIQQLLPPSADAGARSELLSMFQGPSAAPSARGSMRQDPSVPSDSFDQNLLESGPESLVPYAIGRRAVSPAAIKATQPSVLTPQITPTSEPVVHPTDAVHPHAETLQKTQDTQSWTSQAHPSALTLQGEQDTIACNDLSITAASMPFMDEELLWETGLGGFSFDGWLNPSLDWTDLELWSETSKGY